MKVTLTKEEINVLLHALMNQIEKYKKEGSLDKESVNLFKKLYKELEKSP